MANTLLQTPEFLLFFYGGAALGLFYDFLQPLHTRSMLFSCLLDLFFYAGALVFSVILFLETNGYDLRFFALVAMGCGFGAYKLTLSHAVRFLIGLVINGMLRMLEFVSRVLQ